jgi:hypothetical protein
VQLLSPEYTTEVMLNAFSSFWAGKTTKHLPAAIQRVPKESRQRNCKNFKKEREFRKQTASN